jgi:protein-S-isoprenylcysteine O-methyltransferase Ste14
MNAVLKRALLAAIAVPLAALVAAILFLAAGRWDLPFVWAYVAAYALLAVSGLVTVDADLIRERTRSGLRDKSPTVTAAKLLNWAHLITAGLDVGRYHWSDTVPIPLQILGLVGFVVAFGLVVWAMAVNRFFVPTVRIQPERGHHLITSGPYRYVRHPGYAGTIVGVLCSGLVLGSWISVIPMLGLAGVILRRAVLEDRFLATELQGYEEYTERVRFRLFPRVW